MKKFVLIARVLLIAVIVLAGVTTVFTWLANASTVRTKCATQDFVAGYRVGAGMYFNYVASALALASTGWAALGRSKWLRQLFEVHTKPVNVAFGWVEAPFGAYVAYGTLFALASELVLLAGASVARYYAVVSHCLTTNVV
jgi:hypothetical protein